MSDADLPFELVETLLSPSPGAELVAASVGFDHQAVSLWRSGTRHIASFGGSGESAVLLDDLRVRFPMIDVLPGERILICDARTRGSTPNAWVFSVKGSLQAEGYVGDGIEHVATNRSGFIWIGYFDEGIFGRGEYGPHGIVRLNDDLTLDWMYPITGSDHQISDCYTLNVDGDSAMSCFYTEFPIVHIVGDSVSSWTGAPRGSHGLLRRGDTVLLFGGYGEHSDRVVKLRLRADGSTEELSVGRITGLPDEGAATRICRGPDAHVLVGSSWFSASM